MRALITGDRGFLGRHFKQRLEADGYEVTGLDTKAASSQDCRRFFESREGLKNHFDLVVHAAAVIKGRETIDGAPLATAVNLSLDAELFRWASLARPGRVIYFSSSAVYPVWSQDGGPTSPTTLYGLGETAVDVTRDSGVSRPDQVYGWSKVIGEVLAGKLRESGIPVTVVRPFSGYGEDQDDTYPFPAFIARARRRDDPFEVWCGSCVRDFIHVEDVVGGTLAVAADGTPEPVNLCTGRGVSFNDLAHLVMSAAGYSGELDERADKPTGVRHRVGSTLRMLTCYQPKITLEEGIRRALAE